MLGCLFETVIMKFFKKIIEMKEKKKKWKWKKKKGWKKEASWHPSLLIIIIIKRDELTPNIFLDVLGDY
jgi:hypothetical protein